MWCCAIWQKFTDVSEECTASIFRNKEWDLQTSRKQSAACLHSLLSVPEDGVNALLWNIGTLLPDYTDPIQNSDCFYAWFRIHISSECYQKQEFKKLGAHIAQSVQWPHYDLDWKIWDWIPAGSKVSFTLTVSTRAPGHIQPNIQWALVGCFPGDKVNKAQS
jgi:hypothetical protein